MLGRKVKFNEKKYELHLIDCLRQFRDALRWTSTFYNINSIGSKKFNKKKGITGNGYLERR